MKQFLGIFFLFVSFYSFSQGSISLKDKIISYQIPEDTALRNTLLRSPAYKLLSIDEQSVAYFMNYARKNPEVFLQNAINVFLANHAEVKSKYTSSLQDLFRKLTPLSIILPDAAISRVSKSHAVDLITHHVFSHQSSDGRSFQQRLQPVIKGCASECIHEGSRFDALEAVLSLLFDFNVPDLGHRKTMLNPQFTKGGFGIAADTKSPSTILVIDFSCL